MGEGQGRLGEIEEGDGSRVPLRLASTSAKRKPRRDPTGRGKAEEGDSRATTAASARPASQPSLNLSLSSCSSILRARRHVLVSLGQADQQRRAAAGARHPQQAHGLSHAGLLLLTGRAPATRRRSASLPRPALPKGLIGWVGRPGRAACNVGSGRARPGLRELLVPSMTGLPCSEPVPTSLLPAAQRVPAAADDSPVAARAGQPLKRSRGQGGTRSHPSHLPSLSSSPDRACCLYRCVPHSSRCRRVLLRQCACDAALP